MYHLFIFHLLVFHSTIERAIERERGDLLLFASTSNKTNWMEFSMEMIVFVCLNFSLAPNCALSFSF